mgnify:CR=1 FL=1
MPGIHTTRSKHPLAEWRREQSLSLGAVKLRTGIPPQTVHRYENGRIPPPAARAKLAVMTAGVIPDDYHWWLAQAHEAGKAARRRAAVKTRRQHAEARA